MSVFLLTFKPFSRHVNPELLVLSEQVKMLPLLLNDTPVGPFSAGRKFEIKGFFSVKVLSVS